MSQTAFTTLLAATLAGPALAEQFICQAVHGTGFYKGGGQWEQANFTNEGVSYLVDTAAPSVSVVGGRVLFSGANQCKRMPIMEEYLACSGLGDLHFLFNEDLKRFSLSQIMGFVSGDNDASYPHLFIGTCAELGG